MQEKIKDPTLMLQYKCIARFMLRNEKLTLDMCKKLVAKKSFTYYFYKLISSESRFLDPTVTAVGLDFITESTASLIQNALNVKHFKRNVTNTITMTRIVPIIKFDLLYSHADYIWIRYFSLSPLDFSHVPFSTNIYLDQNIYEIYFKKQFTRTNRSLIYEIFTIIENSSGNIIFCSELQYFKSYDRYKCDNQVFLSNYIKFMYCYKLNALTFNPKTMQEDKEMLSCFNFGLIFMFTNNLSNMPQTTHSPFSAMTAERPKTALSKFQPHVDYNVEGTRSIQAIDMGADIGSDTTYITHTSELIIPQTCISDII